MVYLEALSWQSTFGLNWAAVISFACGAPYFLSLGLVSPGTRLGKILLKCTYLCNTLLLKNFLLKHPYRHLKLQYHWVRTLNLIKILCLDSVHHFPIVICNNFVILLSRRIPNCPLWTVSYNTDRVCIVDTSAGSCPSLLRDIGRPLAALRHSLGDLERTEVSQSGHSGLLFTRGRRRRTRQTGRQEGCSSRARRHWI